MSTPFLLNYQDHQRKDGHGHLKDGLYAAANMGVAPYWYQASNMQGSLTIASSYYYITIRLSLARDPSLVKQLPQFLSSYDL
jgi:hypothetical protein